MTICCFQIGKSQCQTALPSYTYDCITATAFASVAIISPGVPPYTYSWIPSGITTQTAANLAIGSHTIIIKDVNNCAYLTQLIINNPYTSGSVAFSNTMVSCFGGNNGASFASFNGSNGPPFSYTWTSGSNNQTAPNLTAGIYSVTIKDFKGCTVTNSVQITEPAQINSTFSNTFITCFGTSISSTIISTGGTPPFTYTVDGFAIAGNVASNLIAGSHTILTKDSKGCFQNKSILIAQVAQPIISFTIIKPSCPGKTDGAITSTISNAPPAYTYTWQPSLTSFSSLSNIPIGSYTLTVKDGSACVTKSVAIVLPAASMSVNITTSPENCSAVDGTATLNVTGGNFPYSFTTQPTVGAHISNTINLLSSGSYTTVVKDANNCLDTLIFNVGNLSTVSVSIVNSVPVLCYNQCTGSIQLAVQNGVLPITYSVSNTPTTSSSFISNLCSGFYVIKAIDAIGCPATTTINFPSPPVFSYSASAPSSVCFGKSVLLQATAFGGSGGYNFIWNPGNIAGQAVNLVPNATTVYSLNVYDSNGCTLAPFQLTVNVNPPISININSSNAGICPGTTAQITPTITGGDGNYNYTWQPGSLNSSSIFVENASIPSYTLSVDDGCGSPTAVKIIPINLFPVIKPIFATSATDGCEPFCTSFINLTPKSSNVIWNYGDKPFEQTGNSTNYCYQKAGIFNIKLTINDSNNCKTSFTYSNVITVLSKPKASFSTNPTVITLNNSENVLIENTTVNGQSYNWRVNGIFQGQTKDISYTFKDTGCNFFRLIATNQNNCVDTLDKFVCVIEGFNFYMPNGFTPNNDNLNDVLIPLGTGWTSKNYLFEVYSRWGNRIFKTNDLLQGWDGKINDSDTNPFCIYYWRVNITDNIGEVHELKGHVTIFK